MDANCRILALAGSTRAASYNKMLVRAASEGVRRAGAEVAILDLRDLSLPLFDEDLERSDGMPAGAHELKRQLAMSHGLLIASPEYNSSVTGVLKNAIDWASRKATADEPELHGLAGKVAVLMSASPGGLGGLRGLVHLRAILGNLRVIVLPEQKAVANAHTVFSTDGSIADVRTREQIEALGARLVQVVQKLNA